MNEGKKHSYKQLKWIKMKREEILSAVKQLSMSQGYYGRLYDFLTEESDEAENALQEMEAQNFGDIVDMVLWIES